MSMLIVAEKPSVALDIAKVLGATQRRDGHLVSADGRHRVTWALGHLLQLPRPHEIDPAWKAWRAELLPMLPADFPLVARDARSQAQLKVIEKLVRDRTTQEIVNACDAGREGELIFRYIMAKLRVDKPCRRLWINALTPDDIQRGFSALKSSALYDGLADAGRARDQADWLLGMNGSRAVRIATGGEFSVGRVQTPTLALVVERDRQIREHVPEVYFEVTARFECTVETVQQAGGDPLEEMAQFQAAYVRNIAAQDEKPKWETRLPSVGAEDLHHPDCIKARALTGAAKIVLVGREERSTLAPELFDLTTLQRTTNYKWGWSASKTLELLQKLYEEHKVVSYPRTDSRHLSLTVAETLPSIVDRVRRSYEKDVEEQTGRVPLSKRFVNDAKVSDHHAIIPTATPPLALAEGTELFALYDLICRRLLGAWQSAYVEAVTDVLVEVTNDAWSDRYLARGVEVVGLGWRRLEPKVDAAGESRLPSGLRADTPSVVRDAAVHRKTTRAPKHHTEATLLGAMENAGEQLGPETPSEIREAMRERGLGTPATRAAIIEMLVARGYIERRGKVLAGTTLGQSLIAAVSDSLKDPKLTGEWEARLRRVERGEDTYDAFMKATVAYVRQCVAEAFERPRAVVSARTSARAASSSRSSGGAKKG